MHQLDRLEKEILKQLESKHKIFEVHVLERQKLKEKQADKAFQTAANIKWEKLRQVQERMNEAYRNDLKGFILNLISNFC